MPLFGGKKKSIEDLTKDGKREMKKGERFEISALYNLSMFLRQMDREIRKIERG